MDITYNIHENIYVSSSLCFVWNHSFKYTSFIFWIQLHSNSVQQKYNQLIPCNSFHPPLNFRLLYPMSFFSFELSCGLGLQWVRFLLFLQVIITKEEDIRKCEYSSRLDGLQIIKEMKRIAFLQLFQYYSSENYGKCYKSLP